MYCPVIQKLSFDVFEDPDELFIEPFLFRAKFVINLMTHIKLQNLDGLNVDFEGPAYHNKQVYDGLTDLMRKLRKGLSNMNPKLELTMAIRYCPFCDSPYIYDWSNIKPNVNYFIIMDYDLQGVAYRSVSSEPERPGQCLTSRFLSNSPFPLVSKGATQFIEAGILGSQLVMALPWYGRSNACIKFNATTSKCFVQCGTQFSRRAVSNAQNLFLKQHLSQVTPIFLVVVEIFQKKKDIHDATTLTDIFLVSLHVT